MWTSSVLFLLVLISSLSESSTNNLQGSGVKLLTSVRVTSAEECNQTCDRVSDQDGLRCNWVVMEEKEKLCFYLHCLDLTVCKLAPVEDVRALQAGKTSFINNLQRHVHKKRYIKEITISTPANQGTLSVTDGTTPTSMPAKETTATSVAATAAATTVKSIKGTNASMTVTSSNSTNTSMLVTPTNASMLVTPTNASMLVTPTNASVAGTSTSASTPEVEGEHPPTTNWTVMSNNSISSMPEAGDSTNIATTNATVAITSLSTGSPLANHTIGGHTAQSVTTGTTEGASTASTKSISLSTATETTPAGETTPNLIDSTASPVPSEVSSLKATLPSSSPTSAIHTTATTTPTTIPRATPLSTTQPIEEKTTATTKQGDKTKTSNSTSRIPSTSTVATEVPETKLKTTAASTNKNEYLFPLAPTVAITKYLANYSLLAVVLTMGLLCFLISVLLFIQKAYDSYKRKDYVQVDYLINGMYADSDM